MAKEIRDKFYVVCNFYQWAEDFEKLEKLNTSESYYVRGRHSNVDCFYLA